MARLVNIQRTPSICITIIMACLIGSQDSPSAVAKGNLHALVIGNSNYENGRLRNPTNDADALSKTLAILGFKVSTLTNVGRVPIEDGILKFSREVSDEGLAFFFFAGHGVQVNGENYLIPLDARIREEFEVRHQCISLSLVLDALENSRSNLNVLVLDCCRDNPFQRGWSRSYRSGLAATSQVPEGTLIAYATSPGHTAADGQNTNSPYTEELVKALSKRPARGLLLRDVFFEASRNVKKTTGQTPWINMEASLKNFYLTQPYAGEQPNVAKPGKPRVDLPLLNDAIAATVVPSQTKPAMPSIPDSTSTPNSTYPYPPNPDSTEHTLERQARIYLQNGYYDNAIDAYSAILGDPGLGIEVLRRVRKSRGSAYIARGGKSDIDRAIIDHKAAGLPGIRLPVRATQSELKIGTESKGMVKRNQILLVTLAQGDWLWVESINDDESRTGYVKRNAILEQVTSPPITESFGVNQPSTKSNMPGSSSSIQAGTHLSGQYVQSQQQTSQYVPSQASQKSYAPNHQVQGQASNYGQQLRQPAYSSQRNARTNQAGSNGPSQPLMRQLQDSFNQSYNRARTGQGSWGKTLPGVLRSRRN